MSQRGIFEKVPRSGEWWIRYADAAGRIRREKAGSKGAAIDLYRKRKTHVLEGRKLPEKLRSASVSFDEIVRDALQYSRTKKVPAAYKGDCWAAEILLGWFRGRVAEEISPKEIEGQLAKLADNGRKAATLNRYRALLSLIYSLAARNGKLSVNPARLVPRWKENNARVRFLDESEEAILRDKIWTLCREREPEFDLALQTGMRRGEQYRLRWQDVDLKREILTIPRSKHGEKRYIPINSAAHEALLALRERTGGLGYVCPGLDGPRNRDNRHWFEDTVRVARVKDFRWHDLRHTFASRLVMAGVDIRTVAELMGHKTLAMTMRYAHLAPAHQRAAIERIAAKRTDTRTSTELISAPARQIATVA